MESMEMTAKKEPLSIGGWLILVAIGIVISPIRLIYHLGTTYPSIFVDGTWEALTTKGSEFYSPIWGPFLVGEIAVNIILVLLGAYLIFLLFAKRASLPKWYLGLALFSTVFILIDAYMVTLVVPDMEVFDAETMKEFGRSLFSLLIWSPYLFYSQRAKDTFINLRTS
ncbi:DUF2569 domain-containing protein [Thalassotalea fusca]